MPKSSHSDVVTRDGELVCLFEYHEGRRTNWGLRYRLSRRASEVARAIQKHSIALPGGIIVDIGTADTLMLERVGSIIGDARYVGIDMSYELLQAGKETGIPAIQGNGIALPLAPNSADVVICTAVIEHVSDPQLLIQELFRIMRPGGLCILTTADPLLLRLATWLGAFAPDEAERALHLRTIAEMLKNGGMTVLEARKFMMSPVGFPFERYLECVLSFLGLEILFLNQIVVARRDGNIQNIG